MCKSKNEQTAVLVNLFWLGVVWRLMIDAFERLMFENGGSLIGSVCQTIVFVDDQRFATTRLIIVDKLAIRRHHHRFVAFPFRQTFIRYRYTVIFLFEVIKLFSLLIV